MDSFEKASFVLGSELWEDDFSSMLDLVRDYIVDVWELRKARLYGENPDLPTPLLVMLGSWSLNAW